MPAAAAHGGRGHPQHVVHHLDTHVGLGGLPVAQPVRAAVDDDRRVVADDPRQVDPAGGDADDPAGQGVVGQGVHRHLDGLAGHDPGGVGLLERHDDLERVGGVQRDEGARAGCGATATRARAAAGGRGQRRGAAGGQGGTADGGETTSPAFPLMAVTVPAAGAVITVSSTSRRAIATAARASSTWARCAAMSCGVVVARGRELVLRRHDLLLGVLDRDVAGRAVGALALLGGVERGLRRDDRALGLLDGGAVGEQAAAGGAGALVGELDVVLDVVVERRGGRRAG